MGIFSTSINVKIEVIEIKYDKVTIEINKQLCDGPHVLETFTKRIIVKVGDPIIL